MSANDDILAAMVDNNGFLRRDSRKSRRPTIAALDDAPPEVTALLAKIDTVHHAGSGQLDEVHTVGRMPMPASIRCPCMTHPCAAPPP